jgi:RIO kinase 1
MKDGVIDTLEYPIARGKEAHVFRGQSKTGPIAVKIFHTSNAVFRNLMQYIEGDPRFGGLKRKHRDLVTIWVRKEHRNLIRMRKWGLNVPVPLGVFRNVLVMEYLGDDVESSPRIKDVEIDEIEIVYGTLLRYLSILWQKAKLVHADFSEYNILWHHGEPVVIDVGQSVTSQHPNANDFLVRDVTRLVEWVNRNGHEVEVAETMYDLLNMDLNDVYPIKEEE